MPDDTNRPSNQPPPRPWKKGDQGHYSSVILEVEVCRDEFGRVFSVHHPQDEADQAILLTWPGGGQEAVSFALLTEALRREAVLEVLLELTKDPKLVEKATASPEARIEVIERIAKLLRVQVNRTAKGMAEAVVDEAIHMVEG